jgi:cytochrome c
VKRADFGTMSDLTFNKYAGAVLATAFVIAGLVQLSGGVFGDEKVAKPGFKVAVSEEAGGAAAAPDVPPDWGTVLKTADPAAGAAVFEKCKSCHNADNGGANGTGPNLWGVVGRAPGSHTGFAYSDGMKAFGAKQPIWDYQHIYEFVKGPQAYINGTKMSFVGLKQPQDRINVIAYLHAQGSTLPIPAPNPAAAAPAAAAAAPAAGAAPAAAPAKPGDKPAAADAPKADAPKADAAKAAAPAK